MFSTSLLFSVTLGDVISDSGADEELIFVVFCVSIAMLSSSLLFSVTVVVVI